MYANFFWDKIHKVYNIQSKGLHIYFLLSLLHPLLIYIKVVFSFTFGHFENKINLWTQTAVYSKRIEVEIFEHS